MARHEVGTRRHGRGDSDEDYDGESDAARAAGRAEGGGNGASRQQSSPHIGVTKVWHLQAAQAVWANCSAYVWCTWAGRCASQASHQAVAVQRPCGWA